MRPGRRVVVTGLGAVSCFGLGVDALWRALIAGRSGRAPLAAFDGSVHRSDAAAEVPSDAFERLVAGAHVERYPSNAATLYALAAAREAVEHAGLSRNDLDDAGCVLGTLSSAQRAVEAHGHTLGGRPGQGDALPPAVECLIPFQLESVVRAFALAGPSSMVSTACASSTDAIGYAADCIRSGEADIMLSGGGDTISEMAHAGFNATFSIGTKPARPFDLEREGFFMGEGAGVLVLESLDSARRRNAPILAELVSYGLSNSAHHLTAPSPDGGGEIPAVMRCLNEAGITPERVDYLNAHGTATRHNDPTEIAVMKHVFGTHMRNVAVSTIKPNIGHCMGAAGALEAVATVAAIRESYIPPTINSRNDLDPELDLVTGDGRAVRIDYAMSESFGFGGASAAVLFAAPRTIDRGAHGLARGTD